MILSNSVKVKIGSNKQLKYYQNKGLIVKLYDDVDIDISLLPIKSHIKIKVRCENCGKEKFLSYGNYNTLTNNNSNEYYCNKCNYVRTKISKLNRYGDENYNNKEKSKQTCLNKYGVENYAKTEKCKKSVKKTKKEKFNDENYNNREKSQKTCIKKYGVKCHLQNKEIKQKIKNTCIEKYGVENFTKTKEFRIKVLKTNLEKYGIENYSNTKKQKETCLLRYGVDSYTKTKEFEDRYKKTCLEKYGVEHPLLNSDILNKYHKSSFRLRTYHNIDYQSTYELDFLIKFSRTLKIERAQVIKYKFKKKTRRYYPDFYLPDYNLIVEIKSDYIYNLNLEMNECKKIGTIDAGCNFLFIIDKNYNEFLSIIEHNNRYI